MEWIPYTLEKWDAQPLPPVKKYVLCKISAKPEEGLPVAIAVGYLRLAAGDPHSPTFTIPGVGGPVEAWCDCLPSDFEYSLK